MITRITKEDMSREIEPSVTSIMIMDNFGNPLAVYLQRQDGVIFATTASDTEFEKTLLNLGVDWETEYSKFRVDKTKRGSHTLTPA